MGEGVSLSLSRFGSPVGGLLVSVPFSREHGFSGRSNLPYKGTKKGVSSEHGFSSSMSVSSDGSFLSEFLLVIVDGARIRKGSNEDIDLSLNADLLETALSGVFPSRNKGVDRLVFPSLGRGFVVGPPAFSSGSSLCSAPATASSDPRGSILLLVELPRSWVPIMIIHKSSVKNPVFFGSVPTQECRIAMAKSRGTDLGFSVLMFSGRDLKDEATSDVPDVVGKTNFVDVAVIDAVNAVRSPKMGFFRPRKTRSADTIISGAIARSGIPKRGLFSASVMDAVAVDANGADADLLMKRSLSALNADANSVNDGGSGRRKANKSGIARLSRSIVAGDGANNAYLWVLNSRCQPFPFASPDRGYRQWGSCSGERRFGARLLGPIYCEISSGGTEQYAMRL